MTNKGILTIISGFSGVGKGTLVKEILERYNNYALSISATTRAPRVGEIDGNNYFFISKEEFESKIKSDSFLEYAKYVENYYGTPRDYVEQQLNAGKDVVLEIEVQGARQVKSLMPEATTIFIMPPDAQTLKDRLIGRNTESMEVIQARLSRASEEAEGIEWYDYVLINDDLEKSVEALHALIQAVHCATLRNKEFINEIREGVKAFSEGE